MRIGRIKCIFPLSIDHSELLLDEASIGGNIDGVIASEAMVVVNEDSNTTFLSFTSSNSSSIIPSSASTVTVPATTTIAPVPATIGYGSSHFCVCARGFEGQMIGCDNRNCLIEWFHFECVGLLQAVRGSFHNYFFIIIIIIIIIFS